MAGSSVWFNGKLVPSEEATISVAAHALHYGSSVFEGIRAYATPGGAAVFCLPQHLRRLFDSARILRFEMPYASAQLHEAILETVRANQHESCYIRPLIFRGPGTFSLDPRKASIEVAIITFEWGSYLGKEGLEQGVDVMVSSWRRAAPDTAAPMAKIGGQYVTSQFIAMEASDHGFTEGIALDAQGFISEGSGENIFVVRDGVVHTPPLSAGVLPGVTRSVVLTLLADLQVPVREEPMLRELLYMADEVFFTGTAAEVTPVRSVDRIAVGEGRRGPITARVQEQFFGITSGRLPDRHGWLTFVRAAQPAVPPAAAEGQARPQAAAQPDGEKPAGEKPAAARRSGR